MWEDAVETADKKWASERVVEYCMRAEPADKASRRPLCCLKISDTDKVITPPYRRADKITALECRDIPREMSAHISTDDITRTCVYTLFHSTLLQRSLIKYTK